MKMLLLILGSICCRFGIHAWSDSGSFGYRFCGCGKEQDFVRGKWRTRVKVENN